MFISNSVMRNLLDCAKKAGVTGYDLDDAEYLLERAEEREERRRKEKAAQEAQLRDKIYNALSDGRPMTPTDVQFIIYNRYGRAYSLPKIAYQLRYMAYRLPQSEERWKNVKRDLYASNQRGQRNKAFYRIEK